MIFTIPVWEVLILAQYFQLYGGLPLHDFQVVMLRINSNPFRFAAIFNG
jgi:hypothetical protein